MENMEMNKETILLTGGAGFIGSYVLKDLLENNYNIILLKKKDSSIERIESYMDKIISYNIDEIILEDIFKKHNINYIIHLATYYVKEENFNDINELINNNLKFPTLLLDLGKKYQINGFIDTGTFFEYDHNNKIISEEANKLPFNLYAASKLSFREILKYYSAYFKIIRLILFSPYGPYDNDKLIMLLFKSIIQNKEFHITKGEQKLDWTYVKDISNSYVLALNYLKNNDDLFFEEFNIGHGNPKSIISLVDFIKEITLEKDLKIYLDRNYLTNEIMFSQCDNSKAKEKLLWEPKIDLMNGLKEIWGTLKK